MPNMELVISTNNINKVKEVTELLAPYKIDVKGLEAFSYIELPPEDGETFANNATIKARAASKILKNSWVLSDDSGLMVEALNGAPGIKSARFAGLDGDHKANNEKLLRELGDNDNRKAAFICVMVLISPEHKEWVVEGRCEGRIASKPRGVAGFGYDPLFIPDGEELTFAEMKSGKKNVLSHRGRALRELKSIFESIID